MSWIDAASARLRLLFARGAAEMRMAEEFRFHIEMEAARLVRDEGVTAREARRRALVAFGGVERYLEELREGPECGWLSGLSLDLRLGARMLVKYEPLGGTGVFPGLAAVGGLGIAVAIEIASVSFGMIYAMLDPSLPIPQGDRIVIIQNIDARLSNPHRGSHLHDLQTWREQLNSVQDLGAFRTLRRKRCRRPWQRGAGARRRDIGVGFTLARVPPLLEADEWSGATNVLVIGEEVWRNRFAADAGIIGRTIRLGSMHHTIVGVMPSGFRFPVNHQFWVPLRLNAADYGRGAAPSVDVFARLADGASIARARTEVETVGRRLATSHPRVYEHVRPQVMPYTHPFFDIESPRVAWAFHLIQALVRLLLVAVGANVAILMYAGTTSRLGEITVRTALGASRRRIVLQLIAEALVLSSIAAAIVGALPAFKAT